jgi:hypothetical protein
MLAGDVRRSGNDCATSGPSEVGEIEKHRGAVLTLLVLGAVAWLEDSILCERAIAGRTAANRRRHVGSPVVAVDAVRASRFTNSEQRNELR